MLFLAENEGMGKDSISLKGPIIGGKRSSAIGQLVALCRKVFLSFRMNLVTLILVRRTGLKKHAMQGKRNK